MAVEIKQQSNQGTKQTFALVPWLLGCSTRLQLFDYKLSELRVVMRWNPRGEFPDL
jgi:hypothetical protein